MTGVASIILALVALYLDRFIKTSRAFWIAAVLCLIFASYRVWKHEHEELIKERERNAAPRLSGRVLCLEAQLEISETGQGVGCYFAINLALWNETPAGTTVPGFSLEVIWEDIRYPAESRPTKGYYAQRVVRHSHPQRDDEMVVEDLSEFPTDVEITNTKHQSGWSRFFVAGIPVSATSGGKLRTDVKITIVRSTESFNRTESMRATAPCHPVAQSN